MQNVSNDHNLMLLSFRCPDTTRSRGWYTNTLNIIDMLMDCPSHWFAYCKCSTKIASSFFQDVKKVGSKKCLGLSNCQRTHGKRLWMKLLAPAAWSALAVLCVAIDLHKVNARLSNVLDQKHKNNRRNQLQLWQIPLRALIRLSGQYFCLSCQKRLYLHFHWGQTDSLMLFCQRDSRSPHCDPFADRRRH